MHAIFSLLLSNFFLDTDFRYLKPYVLQGTPVSERAVPVAIFETDAGISIDVLSYNNYFLLV